MVRTLRRQARDSNRNPLSKFQQLFIEDRREVERLDNFLDLLSLNLRRTSCTQPTMPDMRCAGMAPGHARQRPAPCPEARRR